MKAYVLKEKKTGQWLKSWSAKQSPRIRGGNTQVEIIYAWPGETCAGFRELKGAKATAAFLNAIGLNFCVATVASSDIAGGGDE